MLLLLLPGIMQFKIAFLKHEIVPAGLCSKDQKTIIQNFVKEESTIRLIICTVAFGLGVNIPDVRFVVLSEA
jgi:superfamily II DNA helicase RecQ